MSNAFLLLPEKLARYPITLDEAAYQFGVGRLSDLDRLDLSMDSRIRKGFYARRAVLLNLIGGELHAFVQDVDIGAWYRIPKRYWLPNGYDVEAAVAQPYLPETLDARPGIILPGSGVLGQPIVVWREDVERAAEIIGVLGKAVNDRDAARSSPHGHKPSDDCSEGALPDATDRTGAAGRPSSMHLHIAEMRRRHTAGGLASCLAAEARALADWFAAQSRYAGLARPTPRGIENGIRDIYWELKRPTN